MSRWRPLGLIASGKLIDSPLARHPALCRDLGPVVAETRRLASRYANSLRAGYAAGVAQLRSCALVVVQSEAGDAPRLVQELAGSRDWRGRHFVLLSEDLDARALGALKAQGAWVCSAALAPARARDLLVVEGDAAAVRLTRAWCHEARLKSVELAPGTKPLYSLALLAATALVTPVMDGAMRGVRGAGLDLNEARRLVSYLVETSVRSYRAHGRKSWSSPALPARREAIRNQLGAARAIDPSLAEFLRKILEAALAHYGQPSGWLDEGTGADTGVIKRAAGIS